MKPSLFEALLHGVPGSKAEMLLAHLLLFLPERKLQKGRIFDLFRLFCSLIHPAHINVLG